MGLKVNLIKTQLHVSYCCNIYFFLLPKLTCLNYHLECIREGGESQAAQALVVRSYYFFKKNLYANVQLCETRYRDIVTVAIYCYIMTLRETWLWPFSMWRCYVTTVWIYKGLYGENVEKHFSRNLDIF